MKNIKRFSFLVPVLILIFVFGFSVNTVADEAEIVVRVGHMEPADSFTSDDVALLAKIVDSRSDGRIKIENHPGATLGSAGGQVDGLLAGTHDITLQTSAVISHVQQESYWDWPFLFDNRMQITEFVNSDIRDLLEENYRENDMELLGYFDMGFRHVYNSAGRELRDPAEGDGLQYRVAPGTTKFWIWETVGVSPTAIGLSELYEGLDAGVVDAGDNALAAIYDNRFYEVSDYVTLIGYVYNPMILVAGQPFWQGLPEWAQEIIKDSAHVVETASRHRAEAAEMYYEQYFRDSDQVEVIDLTEEERQSWIEATDPAIDRQAEVLGEELFQRILDFVGKN